MHRLFPSRLGLFLALAWLATGPAPAAEPSSEPLRVMTFNLRYASPTPPHSWPQRRPAVKACLEQYRPDLIGTQEGLYAQLRDIAADQPGYAWIGTGRDGGSRGEFMAIFYRTERFEPLEYDHFWLSDTPNVIGSSTWGNTNRRMVTWVRFRDRQRNAEFYFWNTHLDHALQPAREKGAALIRDQMAALKLPLPLLLVGDFNAAAGANPAYDLLVNPNGLTDLWNLAAEKRNENINSFHDFKGPREGGIRIDWLLGRGVGRVTGAEIITFALNGQFPSDHFPVMVTLEFPIPSAAQP